MNTVDYFWVPESRVVPMSRPPTRIQTVLPHEQHDPQTGALVRFVDPKDQSTKPVIPFAVVHNYTVFFEDETHDWIWDVKEGGVRYYSRIVEHGIWIRAEFEDPKPKIRIARRTSERAHGNITQHLANDAGLPACGAGRGVDCSIDEDGAERHIHCRRCQAIFKRRKT